MRKSLPIVLLSFFLSLQAVSQSLRYSVSMPYISLGAYSNKQADVFSFTNNQAALAQVKSAGVGVYGERRFLLSEVSSYALSAALPTSLGNFGLQLNYAGFANFNENKIGLAYARSLGKKVDVGVQFNYYGYRIPVYGGSSAINFEAGVIMHFSEKLSGGFHVYNPVGGNLGKSEDEKLASAYKFGIGYDASESFYVSTEIIKEEDRSLNVTGGVQYNFKKQFFMRAGFMSETGSGYAGAGLMWKNLRLDISGSYHPQLGISPGILLMTNFKRKEND
ncbi:MAG: hypothetical protein WKF35_00660 [Ferruginibacter sp.]